MNKNFKMANIFNIFEEVKNLINSKYNYYYSERTENERLSAELIYKNLEDLASNHVEYETVEYLEQRDDENNEDELLG